MKESRVKKLLADYQKNGNTKARDEVVLAHLNICRWWVGKYQIPRHASEEKDDLMQMAHLALLEACNTYDPDLDKSNFSSYCTSVIRTVFHRHFVVRPNYKGRSAERYAVPLDKPSLAEDGAPMRLDAPRDGNCQYGWDSLDPKPTDSQVMLEGMAQQLRDMAPDILSSREYEIYKLHFEMGFTYVQIGRQLGISKQAVSHVGKRAQRKLRAGIEAALQVQESE